MIQVKIIGFLGEKLSGPNRAQKKTDFKTVRGFAADLQILIGGHP
jgi:hypothetical protein